MLRGLAAGDARPEAAWSCAVTADTGLVGNEAGGDVGLAKPLPCIAGEPGRGMPPMRDPNPGDAGRVPLAAILET